MKKKNISKESESKDSGTCLRQYGTQQINRTKFKSQKTAQEELNKLLGLEVINKSYVVYLCPICKMWHLGLKEWENKLYH